jgi:type IV pilus assembly protein PilA
MLLTSQSSPYLSRGFSAIELTIVIAATLLVGALGVSAYRTYTVRTQITESVALAIPVQNRVVAAFRESGVPPADRHAAGLPFDRAGTLLGQRVEAIDVINGRIELRFGGTADVAINGSTLSLTPFETADQQIVWICGNKLPGVGLHPLGFSGGSHQAVQVLTMIEPRYLPSACR